ncbi:hypothetical protein T492DRAFT_951239 [Pavlovales sp. CCMP2436]|nr:hypothetical protein T492DRAFT_951239 [Pavlovales sp. CCMP2436]|mmetsp:Transcript_4913/g.12321  ORF Transcript_4913/g.12321 Transcript_4913/m.12321 type:complete len:206 (-) Transcript_4913:214-831(-)
MADASPEWRAGSRLAEGSRISQQGSRMRGGSPGRSQRVATGRHILNISDDDLHVADHPGKGSIKIDEDELNAAFAFFDVGEKGRITAKDMHARLSVFYPGLPLKEVKALITEPVFTKEVLRRLLESNQLAGFDPIKQAFAVYDPASTGYVDIDTLKRIMSDLGFADITDEDVGVLVGAADVDGDGRISLDDFRNMLAFNKPITQK